MACKGARKSDVTIVRTPVTSTPPKVTEYLAVPRDPSVVTRLLFGVDSKSPATTMLQNNLTLFEWVARNKVYPNFWGRYINGENALTKEELNFIHLQGCRVVALCKSSEVKKTESQGQALAEKICSAAANLGIYEGKSIFLEIEPTEDVTRDFMKGFAQVLLEAQYIPAFKANTDAKFSFDREFSRGLQTDRDIFERCLVWATAPSLAEYDRVTTTHLIHPDNWTPFAPSGIKRNDIAVWQYGKDCHPIDDDFGNETTFDINLMRNELLIIKQFI